jgi:hypothetical protein
MKKISAIILVLGAICFSLQADDEKAPPGMEIISIGNVNHIVPKGTKVRKKDGVVTFEGRFEYISRKFNEVEEKISALKEENKILETKFEDLKKSIDSKKIDESVETDQKN